jgi:hypothetical protein
MSDTSKLPALLSRLKTLFEIEDTPVVAVKRLAVVQTLKQKLRDLTTKCRKIQKEPHNTLTTFLFSGIIFCGDARTDPLLPCMRFLDKSMIKELTAKNKGRSVYSEQEAKNVCYALCDKSQEGIKELKALHNQDTQNKSVSRTDANEFQFTLTYTDDVGISNTVDISKFHHNRLQEMYVKHSDDADKQHFLRRLFCLVMRYETLGGPMYQCSCTSDAFACMKSGFGVQYECFASPFNRNAEVYWSAFVDTDGFFGSQGSFFTTVDLLQDKGGSFYANPPFVEDVMLLMKTKIETMLGWKVPVTFVVVIPFWEDEPCHQWMMHQTTSGSAKHRILAEGHQYIEGNQQKNTKQSPIKHTSKFKSSLFLLQNEGGKLLWPDENDEKFSMIWDKFQIA